MNFAIMGPQPDGGAIVPQQRHKQQQQQQQRSGMNPHSLRWRHKYGRERNDRLGWSHTPPGSRGTRAAPQAAHCSLSLFLTHRAAQRRRLSARSLTRVAADSPSRRGDCTRTFVFFSSSGAHLSCLVTGGSLPLRCVDGGLASLKAPVTAGLPRCSLMRSIHHPRKFHTRLCGNELHVHDMQRRAPTPRWCSGPAQSDGGTSSSANGAAPRAVFCSYPFALEHLPSGLRRTACHGSFQRRGGVAAPRNWAGGHPPPPTEQRLRIAPNGECLRALHAMAVMLNFSSRRSC